MSPQSKKQSEKLKPCPFCGSNDLTVKENRQLDGMTFIVCEPCGLVASFCGNEKRNKAVAAWNKRQIQRTNNAQQTLNQPKEKKQ